jgi:hypothetical protein
MPGKVGDWLRSESAIGNRKSAIPQPNPKSKIANPKSK